SATAGSPKGSILLTSRGPRRSSNSFPNPARGKGRQPSAGSGITKTGNAMNDPLNIGAVIFPAMDQNDFPGPCAGLSRLPDPLFPPDGSRIAWGARPPGAPVGRGDGRGTRPATRALRPRLLAGLQPRRQDAGVGLGRHDPAAVGHRASVPPFPGAPRGRSA